MRVIIDSNALRKPLLADWLTASDKHLAVLTDYLWMEIYKGDERRALLESLKVLHDFPNQVLILKGTKRVSAISGAGPGYANAMILPTSKAKFSETIKGLADVERFDLGTMLTIQDHGRVAKAHFGKLRGVSGDLSEFLAAADAVFGKNSTSEIRSRRPFTRDFLHRFFSVVDAMYQRFLSAHPDKPKAVRGKNRINHFCWRYALAGILLSKRYIANGSNVPVEGKVVNDLTDATFAVYGTYFNGIMTSDSNLTNLYLELKVILRRLGARVPVHYLEHPDTMKLFGYSDEPAP